MERILPSALDATKGLDDLLLVWSHDSSTPLARTGAGLTIRKTSQGLEFDAELADTSAARDVHELIRSGISRGCSFSFRLARNGDTAEFRGGQEYRTVTDIDTIYELTLTATPAYTTTSAVARAKKGKTMPASTRQVSLIEEVASARARHTTIVREVDPYGIFSDHSYFLDQARGKRDPEARKRLERARAAHEERSVATTTLGGLVPTQFPPYIAQATAMAVRSGAPLATALEQLPLPPVGMNVNWTKVTTGSTITNQTAEDATITQSADLVAPAAVDPLGTIASFVDFTYQSEDRSGGWFDLQLAADLGAAWSARLEQQVWQGTGAAGQLKGFAVATPGYVTTTSGQTIALALNRIYDAYQKTATNLGALPDLIAMAPSRYGMAFAASDTVGAQVKPVWPIGCDIVISPACPVNLGGSTNEDWIVVLNRASTPLVIAEPQFEMQKQPQSGTNFQILQSRVTIWGYAALGVSRRPEGWSLVKGLTTPVFT